MISAAARHPGWQRISALVEEAPSWAIACSRVSPISECGCAPIASAKRVITLNAAATYAASRSASRETPRRVPASRRASRARASSSRGSAVFAQPHVDRRRLVVVEHRVHEILITEGVRRDRAVGLRSEGALIAEDTKAAKSSRSASVHSDGPFITSCSSSRTAPRRARAGSAARARCPRPSRRARGARDLRAAPRGSAAARLSSDRLQRRAAALLARGRAPRRAPLRA